jgi:hypothetical protein
MLSIVIFTATSWFAAPPTATVDWPSFLGRADPMWSQPPTQWHESGFVGNGKLGAMVRVNPDDGKQQQTPPPLPVLSFHYCSR